MITKFNEFKSAKLENYDSESIDIKNEYSKLIKGVKGMTIDLGKVDQVGELYIKNIEQTYKDAIITTVAGHYILSLKK